MRVLNSILAITLKPTENASSGQRLPVYVEVGPAGRDGGTTLEQSFTLEYTETRIDDRIRTADSHTNGAIEGEMILPTTHPVHEEDWDAYDRAFDEDTVVQVMDSTEEIDVHINMDAAPLQQFLTNHSFTDTGKEYVKRVYKTGVTLYTVAQYIEFQEEFDEDVDVTDLVSTAMRGTGQILLDQTIGDDQLETLTT